MYKLETAVGDRRYIAAGLKSDGVTWSAATALA
jgi:hypothetical protein